MFRNIATIVVVLVAAKVLPGCGFGCDCPPAETRPLVSGRWNAREDTSGLNSAWFPHGNGTQTLEINRAAGTVQITHMEGGSVIVERWRIRPQATP
jgi:hypothetical protein